MRFHKTNDIAWNFSSVILDFCEIAKYFFWLSVLISVKMIAKFWFFEQIWNFKVSNLAIAKVEKVNITVTEFTATILCLQAVTTSDKLPLTNIRRIVKHWPMSSPVPASVHFSIFKVIRACIFSHVLTTLLWTSCERPRPIEIYA